MSTPVTATPAIQTNGGDNRKKGQKDKSKKKKDHSNEIKPKVKVATTPEEIGILKYDQFSSVNFANFERDLKSVASLLYGELFSFAYTDRYYNEPIPKLYTVQKLHDERINELKDQVTSEQSSLNRAEIIAEINLSITDQETYFNSLTADAKKEMDFLYQEEWKS